MPNYLPKKPRAKAMQGRERGNVDERAATQFRLADKHRHYATDKVDIIGQIDWLALFVLSLSVSAMFMACLVYFGEGDVVGATAILAGTAGINAVALFVTKSPVDRD